MFRKKNNKHKLIDTPNIKNMIVLEINRSDESPAFVCEKIAVELEVDRMTDMTVNDLMKSNNVLYISRGQLKNHTSTLINFTIGVRYIHQRVILFLGYLIK